MSPLDDGIERPTHPLALSTDTMVQWIRLYESGVIASLFCVSRPIESETHDRHFF